MPCPSCLEPDAHAPFGEQLPGNHPPEACLQFLREELDMLCERVRRIETYLKVYVPQIQRLANEEKRS